MDEQQQAADLNTKASPSLATDQISLFNLRSHITYRENSIKWKGLLKRVENSLLYQMVMLFFHNPDSEIP